jgi:hypothetical protein
MRWGSFLFLWLFLGPVFGAQVNGLYEATAPAEGKNSDAQAKAMEAALGKVLVKLSGDSDAATKPGAGSLLKNAQTYVQEYGYLQTPSANQGAGSPHSLRAVFDPQTLNKAMKQAGLRVWGRERPTALIWLAVDEGGVRQIVTASSPHAAALETEAARIGLPIAWPLLDLEDESALSADSLAAGDGAAVLAASRRYQPDAILAGQLAAPVSGSWEGHWTLFLKEKAIDAWTSSGAEPRTALDGGIDRAAKALAAKYVPPVRYTTEERIELLIEGITTVDDYARVQHYLWSLDGVQNLSIKRLETNQGWFSVLAQGGAEALNQSIALGGTLQVISPEEGRYQLLPEY